MYSSSSSHYVKTVVLREWWLVRTPKEFEGKTVALSGLPVEERAKGSSTSRALKKVDFHPNFAGRLLLRPMEFWRNEKAVYDSSRQITGIVIGSGTPDSGEASGTIKKKKRKREGGRV